MGRIIREKVGGYDDNEVEKAVLQVFFNGNDQQELRHAKVQSPKCKLLKE